jgi:hypothetical protein
MKMVKERPEHLLPRATVWMEEEEDTDNEADIQLGPSRPHRRRWAQPRGSRSRDQNRR